MNTNLEAPFSMTEANALFKTDFKEYRDDTFNTDIAFYSEMSEITMTGKATEFPVPFGYAGGISGTSPGEVNTAQYETAHLTDKSLFARAKIGCREIDASMSSKGSFVKAMQEVIEKTVESAMWLYSFCLFGDGSGKAGTIKAAAGVTDNGGGLYDCIIGESSTDWKEANFEERIFYNIGTGETDLFECTAVDPSLRKVSFQAQAGATKVPVESDAIFIQKLENAAPMGLAGVAAKVVGNSLYNITCNRRWVMTKDATGGAISHSKVNNLMAAIEKKVGKKKMPNRAYTSYAQMAKLYNLSENDKRYEMVNVKPAGGKFSKTVGFNGIQILTSRGPITVVPDKFCEDDRFYALNVDETDRYQMPNAGWFAKDGTTFLRETDEDQMEARHIVRMENYIAPVYQAVMTGLSV